MRPACGYCSSARVNCVYNTCSEKETHAQAFKRKLAELSDREATYQQIFDNLRSRSEAESCEIVRRIQAGASPESILRYIKDADLLLQLALVPETRYRYVFPLVQEMPACLVRPDNPYLGSPVYEWTTSSASTDRALLPSVGTCLSETQSPYVKPFHSAEVVEPLLNSAKPSDWTQVSSDDALMRKLLAFYFSGEYHWFPPFQKDYFLQDMAAGRNGCCSPLLVNAVLAVASVSLPSLMTSAVFAKPPSHRWPILESRTAMSTGIHGTSVTNSLPRQRGCGTLRPQATECASRRCKRLSPCTRLTSCTPWILSVSPTYVMR